MRVKPTSFSLTAMFALALLCFVAGVLPGYFIDALAPVVQGLVNAHMPRQTAIRMASRSSPSPRVAAPTTACCCSSSSPARRALPPMSSIAGRRTRPGAARPLGLRISGREPSHAIHGRQLRATDSTRVRNDGVPSPARKSTCRRPAIRGPRDCMSISTTSCGTALYAPVAKVVGVTADVLNRVQFLTIRGYLTLVSGALVALLVILAVWQ